jgi:CTP:molybdopterin cytidylyltransferase MocA
MGQPKPLLPWGAGTVIAAVCAALADGGAAPIVVVTRPELAGPLRAALAAVPAAQVRVNPNPDPADMVGSLQVGLRALPETAAAALVALGDMPLVRAATVRAVRTAAGTLVCPSSRDAAGRARRGHPWRVGRALWPALLALAPPQTLRDFLDAHAAAIQYVAVDDDGIWRDLDTPADYAAAQPPEAV